MTEEQAKLIIEIITGLDTGAVSGEWPNEHCQYCPGKSDGYYDSQGFTHDSACIVLKIERLRITTWNL